MNFFLDENIPKSVTPILEKSGDTVYDIRGSEKEGITDKEIFNLSQEKMAIFLTTDKDFLHSIHIVSKPHHGIVIILLSQPNTKSIIEKIKILINKGFLFELESKCLIVRNNKISIYQ